MAISVSAALFSMYGAFKIYTQRREIAEKFALKFKKAYMVLLNKYYVDEFYEATVIQPIQKSSEKFLWKIADNKLIDGIVNGTAVVITSFSSVIKKMQTGVAQVYALIMMTGIAAILFWIILSL